MRALLSALFTVLASLNLYAATSKTAVELIQKEFAVAQPASVSALALGETWSCTGFNASDDQAWLKGFAVTFNPVGPAISMDFKYMYSVLLAPSATSISGYTSDLRGTMFIRQAANGDLYGEVASKLSISGNLDSVSSPTKSAVTYWFCPISERK